VQANHGARADLRVDSVPAGRYLPPAAVPTPDDYFPASPAPAGTGSIIVVIATDAPVLGDQCRRLAQRASIGLGRSGGGISDSSGDIFLAFSTAKTGVPPEFFGPEAQTPIELRALPHQGLSALFAAVAEATEEAILNALLSAGDMTGRDGITAHGLTPQALSQAFALAADDLQRTAVRLGRTEPGSTPVQPEVPA